MMESLCTECDKENKYCYINILPFLFTRGSQWTGSYVLEFRDLIDSTPIKVDTSSEARFSFLQGGYVEDFELQGILYVLFSHAKIRT